MVGWLVEMCPSLWCMSSPLGVAYTEVVLFVFFLHRRRAGSWQNINSRSRATQRFDQMFCLVISFYLLLVGKLNDQRASGLGGLMDGWMDGWLDGWLVGWLDGWLVGGLGGWLVGWMDGGLDGWLDGWLVGGLDGWLVGWMDDWMDGWLVGWMDGWLVGWLDEWLVGGLDGCFVGGWLVACLLCWWMVG